MGAYRVVLRRIGTPAPLAYWDAVDGHTMTYPQARQQLVDLEQTTPGLHDPGCRCYLEIVPGGPL